MTDSESAWLRRDLEQMLADAKAAINKDVEGSQGAHLEAMRDAFSEYSRELCDDITRH